MIELARNVQFCRRTGYTDARNNTTTYGYDNAYRLRKDTGGQEACDFAIFSALTGR